MYCRTVALVVAILFGIALAVSGETSPQEQTISATKADSQLQEQAFFSALWLVDHNFQSTLRIRNAQTNPITVYPLLFMQDGSDYPLSAVTIQPISITAININDALAEAPPHIAKHFSQYGSAAVRFRADSPFAVTANVELVDPVSSL